MAVDTRRVILDPEPEGGYTVTVPSLPGCLSCGETWTDALYMIQDAITLYLETLVVQGEPIPPPDALMPDNGMPLEFCVQVDILAPLNPKSVAFTKTHVIVQLEDGRIIGNPLSWHPWLADATNAQRDNYVVDHFSIDWPDLDEGLDIEGMLRGIQPSVNQQLKVNLLSIIEQTLGVDNLPELLDRPIPPQDVEQTRKVIAALRELIDLIARDGEDDHAQ